MCSSDLPDGLDYHNINIHLNLIMWQYLLLITALLVLSPILAVLFKCIMSKINLRYYERQGLKTYFFPFIGFFGVYSKSLKENQNKSNLNFLRAAVDRDPDSAGFAVNQVRDSGSILLLHNAEYIKEFFRVEDQFIKQSFTDIYSAATSFVFMNGEEAMNLKRLVSGLFKYENLSKYTPVLSKMIAETLRKIAVEKMINSREYVQVDVESILNPVFEIVLSVMVHGRTDLPKIKGISLLEFIRVNSRIFEGVLRHPLFALMPWFFERFQILPVQKKLTSEYAVFCKFIEGLVKERENEQNLGDCVLDHMILHNRQCKESGNMQDYISLEMIQGTVNVMQLAATESAQSTSTLSICLMTDRPDLQQAFDGINSRVYDSAGVTDSSKLDADNILDLWTKEALRLCTSASNINPRIAKHDVKIKDITVRAGDGIIIIPDHATKMKAQSFDDPDVFKIDRFAKKIDRNILQYQYMPFSAGKRACPGWNLGELMVKLAVSQFCRLFEFRRPDGIEYYVDKQFVNTITNPVIEIRLKAHIDG